MSRSLKACPNRPNCVSSMSKDPDHYVSPLTFPDDPGEARRRLIKVIESMPRSRIVTAEDDFIHAVFKSRLFRFVDDVEFLLDIDNRCFQVRSASRLGYSDMGVNRKRVEEIRSRFLSG